MNNDCIFCVYSDTDMCKNCYNNIMNENNDDDVKKVEEKA